MEKLVAFDTETHLIQPGLLAPPLVCASYADESRACLLSADEARFVFRELLQSNAIVAGANLPFDIAVMAADAERRGENLLPLIFAKYERGEVHDIIVAQSLDAIAGGHLFKDPRNGGGPLRDPATGEHAGRYSLSVCCDLVLGRQTAKVNDFWRERYALLERVPMPDWPWEARQYPIDDAVNTRDVALVQRGTGTSPAAHEWVETKYDTRCEHCNTELTFADPGPCTRTEARRPFRNLTGMVRECRADLALHLGALWGLRVNKAWLDTLEAKVDDQHQQHQEAFAEFFKSGHKPGCLRRPRNPDGSVNCVSGCDDGKENGPLLRRRIALAYNVPPDAPCRSCGGSGRRRKPNGNEVNCSPRNFPGEECCDGTGLDLYEIPPGTDGARAWRAMVPRTDGGGICANRDALIESGDEQLMAYGDDEFEKIRTTYVPFLRRGVEAPLCLSPNILVSSFRTSYYGPIQQMPRDGEVRTSFEARPGRLFASCDYSGIELCTLAQVCLWTVGFSRMADIINETGDPGGLHAAFGAQMLGTDPTEFKKRVKAGDKAAKDFRQAAKAANFGFPGGMGAAKLVLAKRKKNEGKTYSPTGPNADKAGRFYWGIRFCILLGGAEACGVDRVVKWKERDTPPVCRACCVQAEVLRERWLAAFPEMPKYFDFVNRMVDAIGEVRLPFPGSTRGGVGFTDGANGHFQELAALLAKTALWDVTAECYVDPASPLYGTTRIPFFVHDEIFADTLEAVAHLTAPRIGLIMEETGTKPREGAPRGLVPDVKIKVEPALSRRWLKAMEPAFDAGQLIAWENSAAGRKYLKEKGWEL